MVNFKKFVPSLLLLLVACVADKHLSDTYKRLIDPANLTNSKKIDFSSVGDDKWTKVCFFGPYTVEGTSKIALGFDWEVTQKTDIGSNEGINVVVFTTDTEVTEYLTIPRNKIDRFADLPTPCIPRSNAVFTFEDTSYIYRRN